MFFKNYAKTLINNGYNITPLVLGRKNPVLKNWVSTKITADLLRNYDNCGVGVLTGAGPNPIIALDIDTHDIDLVTEFKAWCFENLGDTCERIGAPPKSLLVYRIDKEITKKTSKNSMSDRLEILGKGQQFVAYNIHPKTLVDYRWVDLYGGIVNMPVGLIPIITEEQINAAIVKFEELVEKYGLATCENIVSTANGYDQDDLLDLLGIEKAGLTLDEAERLLSFTDNNTYDTWLKAGMALHHEFNGSAEALQLWDTWSSTAKSYKNFSDLQGRWDGFTTSKDATINAFWLVKQEKIEKDKQQQAVLKQEFESIKREIAECPSAQKLLVSITPKAGLLTEKNPAFIPEFEKIIPERYKIISGMELQKTVLKKYLTLSVKKQELKLAKICTEFANADRMAALYADQIMYDAQLERWYLWNGVHWRDAIQSELEELARNTVNTLRDEIEKLDNQKDKQQLAKFYIQSQRATMCKNMVFLLRSYRGVYVFNHELDANVDLVAVKNGTLNVKTGELLPSDPKHRITQCMRANYDPNAQCPLFEQTLSEAFYDDAELVSFFKRLMGYILLGNPKESLLVLPYGDGSNGKSTIFNAINYVVGDYSKTAASDLFLARGISFSNPGGAREDLLHLRGARFVYVSEPEEDGVLKEGIVKAVTGGDKISARGMYSKNIIEFEATWTNIIPTNHKPTVKGFDNGIWRRILLIPFLRNFEKDPFIVKDLDRKEKVLREADGILTWLVEGAQEYLKTGLRIPKRIYKEREDYKEEMDLVQPWIDDYCDVSEDSAESLLNLWKSWEEYATRRGIIRMLSSSTALSKRLKAKGFDKIRNSKGISGVGYSGIKIKDCLFS